MGWNPAPAGTGPRIQISGEISAPADGELVPANTLRLPPGVLMFDLFLEISLSAGTIDGWEWNLSPDGISVVAGAFPEPAGPTGSDVAALHFPGILETTEQSSRPISVRVTGSDPLATFTLKWAVSTSSGAWL